MSENWFEKLFIKEAKPALSRHSGGGGSGGLSMKLIAENVEPLEGSFSGMMFFPIGQDLYGKTILFRTDLYNGTSISFTMSMGEKATAAGTFLSFDNTGIDGDTYMAIMPAYSNGMYVEGEPLPGLLVDVRSMPSGTQIGDTAKVLLQPKLTVYSLE